MYEKIYFLSGLPRSGSTLLSSILSQNDSIYSGGHSALCQIMWDFYQSCNGLAKTDLLANNRVEMADYCLKQIPQNFYSDINKKIVIDKNGYWTNENNFFILKKYISEDPKIIVTIRSVDEILKSFINIHLKNGIPQSATEKFYLVDNHLILRSCINSINWSLNNNENENFLYVKYDHLIDDYNNEISKIYTFLNLDYYQHDYNNISNIYPENDNVYGLSGLHDIRNTISRNYYDVTLSDWAQKECDNLNKLIFI